MKVVGCDIGGRRARLCLIDPAEMQLPYMIRAEHPKLEPVTAARAVNEWTRFLFSQTVFRDVGLVWIEEPRGRSHRAVHQLSMMAGAIAAAVPKQIPVELVPAGECRVLVGLPGNATKTQVVAWATGETALEWEMDDHDADAYVVARAVYAHGAKEKTGGLPVVGAGRDHGTPQAAEAAAGAGAGDLQDGAGQPGAGHGARNRRRRKGSRPRTSDANG